ncbi:hypothetical protein NA56DRAFT_659618 [Hyaloscypha hepaticicola]|uniref:2EXR domain-containing protein n=1 Tax=Hyaloscypha hepaticicola TaxID=2082293 RepID=A0A2J6Q2V3_9HELO|nr:hypothetical protein NA56DRAFT_659618 [Hyaloscypha hepaticicola]
MITSKEFVTYDERMSHVRNFLAGHNAQTVPCILHVCAESRSLGLKTYQLAFATQLRGRPTYFDFQDATLYMKDSFALESFCDGCSDFEKTRLGGDLKENIRHLALGTDCAQRKILVEWANWRMEAEVENLQATWRSRLERENAENAESQNQSEGSASSEVGDQEIDESDERLLKIQWLTEAELRQKSNREREARHKGAKRVIPPAPYKPPEL